MQMKKISLLSTMIASSALWLTAAAQQPSLQADFEGDAVTANGWTEYHTGTKALWTVTKYASEAQLKSTLSANKLGALQCAVSRTGGTRAVGNVNPSNWLISPAVTVASGDHLNYQVAYGPGYNTAATVTSDDQRIRLEVLVSTTSADTTAFTDTIRCEIPKEYADWSFRSLDLSKYAGKTIYIAFHDHGTPLSNFVSQNLFLDNVEVASQSKIDQGVSRVNTLISGTITSQPITVRVSNNGAASSGYTVSYDIDGANAVTETVNKAIASGDTILHTFAAPATFAAGSHTVHAWTSTDNDAYFYNDSASTTVTVLETASLPYEVTSSNITTDLAKSYGTSSAGWYYMSRYDAWIYSPTTKASYLYTTKGIALKKGKVKVRLYCTSTAANAVVTAYLSQVKGQYAATQVGSKTLELNLNQGYQNFIIDVPEDGNYIISLGASSQGQIAVSKLTYCEPYEDIQAVSVATPAKALVAQSGVPVTIKVYNDGIKTQTGVKVYYKVDSATAVQESIASIEPATSVEYTFSTKADLSTVGNHTIQACVDLDGDGDESNDYVTGSVYTYAARQFPYQTSFETATDSLEWSAINVDGDDAYWGVESTPSYCIDGTHTLYLNYVQGQVHNDYAVSPAIALSAGQKGRVSFYYGLSTLYGGSKLKVVMSKEPTAEALANGTVLQTINISQMGYSYANAYFTVPDDAAGNYYFAILATGGYDQIFVDDFRVNADSELAVTGLKSSTTGSSYDPADAEITVGLSNYGLANLSGAKFTCTITGVNNDGDTVSTQTLTGTYSETIEGGEIAAYTFPEKAKFDEVGTYTIAVAMTCDGDADSKNNSWQITGPTKWKTFTVPVTLGFEDTNDNKCIQVENKWTVSTYTPYDGKRSFAHSGVAGSTKGDWAFLNRVHVPAGTYDVSFFWKTMTNNDKDTYSQNFAVYLGTAAVADSMKYKVAELTNALNADHKATKELAQITLPEGDYFFGLQSTTTNTYGYVILDQFTIALPDSGIAVTAEAPYTADFGTRESEWYHYHPSSTSNQWTLSTADLEPVVSAQRTYTSWAQTWKTPGIYRAPAFKLQAGNQYEATYTYTIDGTDDSNPLDGQSQISLLLASRDVPSEYNTTVATGTESYIAASEANGTATGTFTVPTDGVYYLGFTTNSNVSAKFGLYTFSLKLVSSTGVSQVVDGTTVNVKRNLVEIVGPYTQCTVYTVGGVAVAQVNDQSTVSLADFTPGAYLVQVTLPSGKQIVKKVAVAR